MSHTPGPWRVGEKYAPNFINELPCVRTLKGEHIAYVYTEGYARLIAAAPELLEALKYARRMLNGLDHDAAYLAEVIAKAEGK